MYWIESLTGLVALGSLGVAIWARLDARKARSDAKRSADAAERTAGITNDLYEQGRVQFSLQRSDNTLTRILTNNGTHTAYDVSVSAPNFTAAIVQDPPIELHPGAQIKITTRIPGGLRDKRLLVAYKEIPTGPQKEITLHA